MSARSKELWRSITRGHIRRNPDFQPVLPKCKLVTFYKAKLEETVFGQERACLEVARALVRSDGGLISPDRPEFIGMFLGAPGCGKTEMGRAIARIQNVKEPEKNLLIIDCNTFQDDIDIHKITGSTPGYVGYGDEGLITADFLARPNVIVFDEIEKAHRKLHRLLLGIMDRGKLVVPVGTSTYRNVKNIELNFAYSKIIFTSNVGSQEIRDSQKKRRVGFHTPERFGANEAAYKIGIQAMKERWHHMPEFLDRLDSVVVFEFLTPSVYRKIFDKFLDECNQNQRLRQNNPLAVTDELRSWIISETDTDYGGRELRRTMERHIITPFAELKQSLDNEVPVVADISEDKKVEFWVSQKIMAEAREKARIALKQLTSQEDKEGPSDDRSSRWEKRKRKKHHRRRYWRRDW